VLSNFLFTQAVWLLLFSLDEKSKQKNQVSLILVKSLFLPSNTPYGRLTKHAQSNYT